MTQELAFYSTDLAAIIGLEAAAVFNKIQWCIENSKMEGTPAADGTKMIRNPIVCTNPRKIEKSHEHSKLIDWLSNFKWATPHKLRRILARIEALGLIVVSKLRAYSFDQCKYYSVNYEKLAELLKDAPLSICAKPSNRSCENDHIDRATERKSYQDTYSIKALQLIPLREAGATVDQVLEIEEPDQEKKLPEDCLLDAKEVTESVQKTEVLERGKSSVRSSSPERKLFFERLLTYCYQRVDIDSPEGYANWVLRESKSIAPEASVAMLWDEFTAGEELGSRLVPPGFKLRGVPEQVVAQAIAQDCISKVGATATEAAKNAAGQLRRLPVVAAVANAVKLQLEHAIESATRQVELGVPKEQAIANNLPTYAVACVENPLVQIEGAIDKEPLEQLEGAIGAGEPQETVDPYALTPESLAAREKAKASLRKRFGKPTKAEEILAANIVEVELENKNTPAVDSAKAVVVEEYDDFIPW